MERRQTRSGNKRTTEAPLQNSNVKKPKKERIKKKESDKSSCSVCAQNMNKLTCFLGDPDDALDEMFMLTSATLCMPDEDDASVGSIPQHRLTDFSVYDEFTHLCPFDTGLIEKNKRLYVSGYVKQIYDDSATREGGVAAKNVGPINEWFFTGFDGGEKVLFGFTTEMAEYILTTPSAEYAPFMKVLHEKAYLSKIVIEFLQNDSLSTYEDLINKIQVATPPQGMSGFTEDKLLRHAQFIIDQVESYDSAADVDENLLITTPCMISLVKLAGVTLGKRRKIRTEASRNLANRTPKTTDTKATTTPLVREIFENLFVGQIDDKLSNAANRRRRCGVCDICQQPDCGNCYACKKMVKFGGSGKMKQACAARRCPNLAIQEADDRDSENESDEIQIELKRTNLKLKTRKVRVSWVGKPIFKNDKNVYYSSVKVKDETISCGDCVFVSPDNPKSPTFPAKVIYMWEDKQTTEKFFHAHWFYRGTETVLGEASVANEVFIVDECEDTVLESIMCKCEVVHKPLPNDWSTLGGKPVETEEVVDEKITHYQKLFNKLNALFEDPPESYIKYKPNVEKPTYCPCCDRLAEMRQQEMLTLGKKISGSSYESVRWNAIEYFVGNCVFLTPEAFQFNVKQAHLQHKDNPTKTIDEDLHPEYYRKTNSRKNDMSQKEDVEPFRLGYVEKIICDLQTPLVNADDVQLVVKKFYRPENTHLGCTERYNCDFHMVYWSEEETSVKLSKVRGKCFVKYCDIFEDKQSLWKKGPEYFYFSENYNSALKKFEDPSSKAQSLGNIGKGKGIGKGAKGKTKVELQQNPSSSADHEISIRPLRAMDIFAGCGGLSEGLHQSGLCNTEWAIEKEEAAARAFRLNNPDCTVFNNDCNTLLKLVMDGERTNDVGQRLPQKGEVELLCGGPPCQGFSGMNRFTSRQYSQFKNSLIVSYLSYCDYYRPRFFLLENVRAFISYKKNLILKLTLHCLIRMGYQCTVGVLQAGNFGVPQTRRRVFIFAAAPGEKLPSFPVIRHSFSTSDSNLCTVVDDEKYTTSVQWIKHAPYRRVTVRDSLSDLPPIANGAQIEEIAYNPESRTHYQRLLQESECPKVIYDHVCKEMNPLVVSRIEHIPCEPFADWRDLPNIIVQLSDGTTTKKLVYTHHDAKNGKSSSGGFRGVCSCAETNVCDPSLRQHSTLIPWCLPHTGNRHNNWSGLYGRLNLDGCFKTTITNPEPMGKQGQVLHPNQHRVISVRECARSQGFPDSYRFYGTVLDRHKQIGNAVPPPLAAAIGLQFKKCVVEKILAEKIIGSK